jgi:hypothetical protein
MQVSTAEQYLEHARSIAETDVPQPCMFPAAHDTDNVPIDERINWEATAPEMKRLRMEELGRNG